ncbi:MAG: metal ABC transporter permease [Anaerovibrio sp.]|uniref:metal ABC transporter permease n=1 Tax=Anaerovibrio sp. TaxID=1872532 RepID=UPI0025C49F2F|nr:metal ABC transporter permease [Anaerovibrio sp.]MBE6099083.1 metal ABC transporter permease [Anaerovibrio sp.]
MEIIYSLMDTLLPFEWLSFDFMKNAFLAILLITPLFGLLSTMVVSNRMAFFSDSLGHGAFTGLAIGAIAGLLSPMSSLVAFSIVFALLITWIKNYSSASTDTIIGVFSSTGIAVGLMIMSYGGGFNKFSGYLIGDVLSITPAEIGALLGVLILVVVLWGVLFNQLLLLSVNQPFARSRGLNVMLLESVFAVMVAVVVAISIQWVGLLIINSLLVLPGATARNMANSVKQYHALSVGSAMIAGITGLVLAYQFNMAAGATIVFISAMLFFISMVFKAKFVR